MAGMRENHRSGSRMASMGAAPLLTRPLVRSSPSFTRNTVPIFSSFQSHTVRIGYTAGRLGHVHRYHPHSTLTGRQRVLS